MRSDSMVSLRREEFSAQTIAGGGISQAAADARYILRGGDTVVWPLTVATGLAFQHTWNNGAQVYTGLSLAVTNTASAAGSRLAAFTVGGTTVWQVFPSTAAYGDAGAVTYLDSGTTVYSILSVAGTLNQSGGADRAIPFYINAQFTGSAPIRALRAVMTVPAGNANAIGSVTAITFVYNHLGSGSIAANPGVTFMNPGFTLNNAGATITALCVYYYSGTTVTAGTLTTQTGLMFPALTQATNNSYIVLGQGTAPAGNWAIFSATTNPSQFNGPIALGGIGVTNVRMRAGPGGSSNTVQFRLGDDSGNAEIQCADVITTGATFALRNNTGWTNGAGVQAGTLLNAPAVGNPTKWIQVDDNGTTRFIPAW